jgi:hypothetical protein
MLRTLLLLMAPLTVVSAELGVDPLAGDGETPAATKVEPTPAPLRFELGGESPTLLIPRNERLEFGVHVSVGPAGATVGTVDIESGVDPYVESMLFLGGGDEEGETRETGWLRAKADGGYFFYDMVTVLDSRYLPKEWPRASHFYRQTGSENRRRESSIGFTDGRFQLAYRGDTRHGAPSGQRIWKDLEYRDVPDGCVDMLGAVFLARTLLDGDKAELSFPLLDKTRLWKMTLKRGEAKELEVPFGRFEAMEIILIPDSWPGEPEVDKAEFRGLFGIKGSIHLWVEKNTGVPLRIEGTMPAGPVEIDCDIYLEKASGTPVGFKNLNDVPVQKEAADPVERDTTSGL